MYLLRCYQIGLKLADMEQLSYGMILDMITELKNDDYEYKEMASQDDFDKFAR